MPPSQDTVLLVRFADSMVRGFDLQTPLVKALVGLARDLKVDNFSDAFAAIVEYLNGAKTLNPAQKQTIETTLGADSSIRERVAALLSYAGRETEARFLSSTLDDAPQSLFAYRLTARPGTRQAQDGDVLFQLTGKADAGAEIQIHKTAEAKGTFRLEVPPADAVLRLGLDGEIDVKGSVKSSFSSGTASGSASAGASVELNLLFQYPLSTYYVDALVASALGAVLPWDLPMLAQRLSSPRPDGRHHGLRALHVSAKGQFELAGEVGVGVGWQYRSPVRLGQHESVVGLTATAGLKLNARLRRHGTFSILVERSVDDTIIVDVAQASESTRSLGVDFGADLEITGLDQLAAPFVRQLLPALPGFEQYLDELTHWSQLGDRLHDRIATLTAKELGGGRAKELMVNLTRYLVGVEAQNPLKLVLDELAGRAQQAIDERVRVWSGDLDTVATELVSDLSDRLGLDTETALRGDFEATLLPILQEFIADQRTKFDDWIAKTLNEGQDKLEQYLAPLDAVGEKSQELATSLRTALNKGGNQAKQAILRVVEPFQRLLGEYEQLRNRVVKALEQTAKIRLAMHWSARTERTMSRNTLLRFAIREIEPQTVMLYRAALTGRLGSVWQEFVAAATAGKITILDGMFATAIGNRTEIGFSFEIFGRAMTSKQTKLSDVEVEVDAAGRLVVGTVSASSEKLTTLFGSETRAVSGFATFDVATAMRPGAAPTPLGFSMSYADKHMTDTEIRQYLGSLERARVGNALLPPGSAERAADWLKASGTHEARIDILLGVDREVLSKLALVSEDQVFERAVEYQVLLFAHEVDRQNIANGAVTLPQANGSRPEFVRLVNKRPDWVATQLLNEAGGSDAGVKRLLRTAQAVHRRASAMQLAVRAIQRLEQGAKSVVAATDDPRAQADRIAKELDGYGRDIADALSLWLGVNNPVKGIFTERLPDSTIAFLALLADLVDAERPLLLPMLTAKRGGAASRYLIV